MIEWLISTFSQSNCATGNALGLERCGAVDFTLTVHVQSVLLKKQQALNFDNERVCVSVCAGGKSTTTELRYCTSSKQELVWSFNDILNVDVSPVADLFVKVLHTRTTPSRTHDPLQAWEALAPITPDTVAELTLNMSTIRRELQPRKNIDGVVYVTPKLSFDLYSNGIQLGCAYLAFETKQAPRSMAEPNDGTCQVMYVSDTPLSESFAWPGAVNCCSRTVVGRRGHNAALPLDAHHEDVKIWEAWAHRDGPQDSIDWGQCANDIVLSFEEPEQLGTGLRSADALGDKASAEDLDRLLLLSLFARVEQTEAGGQRRVEASNVFARLKEVAQIVRESDWDVFYKGGLPSSRPGSMGFLQAVIDICLVDDKWRLPFTLEINSVDTPFMGRILK